MLVDYFTKTAHTLVLRKYSTDGCFYLVRICKLTQCIISIERASCLPGNWSESYINQLLIAGDQVFKKKVAYT